MHRSEVRFTLGDRVAIRSRIDAPTTPSGAPGPSLTDTVGDVVELSETVVTLSTRRGPVTLALADVTAARVIPPRPTRRGAPHRAISLADLHRVMTKGCPGLDTEWLGTPGRGWLLRAGGGYTARANSALPLGDPGMPQDAAVDAVRSWYHARGLEPQIQVPLPLGATWHDDPLCGPLLRQGWDQRPPVLVLTGRVAGMVGMAATGMPQAGVGRPVAVEEHPALTEEWIAHAGERVGASAEAARAVLGAPPDQVFLLARDLHGEVSGVARVVFADGWAGLFSVHVMPEQRRAGVGRALTVAAARAALRRGVSLAYLQVEAANQPTLALYDEAGLQAHHQYAVIHPAREPR